MEMPCGGATGGQARFRETLLFYRCIRVIENAPNGRTIGGDERFLIGKLLDSHTLNTTCKMKKYKAQEEQLRRGAFAAMAVYLSVSGFPRSLAVKIHLTSISEKVGRRKTAIPTLFGASVTRRKSAGASLPLPA